MSDRLMVTGKWRHGKFDHRLPKELADLYEKAARLLREHGGAAIHMAEKLSAPSTTPDQNIGHGQELAELAYHLKGSYRHTDHLVKSVTTLVSHATDADTYEVDDGGCRSCRRNAGHWEPRDFEHQSLYCSRCRNFKARFKVEPPLQILTFWHSGGKTVKNSMLIEAGVITADGELTA